MNSVTDGSPVTSGTPTVYYTIDGGTQATGGGTATHKGNGQWEYSPLQAETNGDHVAFTMVLSGAITQTVNVYPVAFDPTDSVRLGLTALPNAAAGASGGLPLSADSSGRVDIGKWKGSTPADLTDTDKVQVSIQHLPDGIITAAKLASNAITAAKIAAGALDGKGDWNVGKTGYSLSADQSGVTIGTVGTVTNAVTVGTNNDKSGYSIASTGLNGVTLPANIISADSLSAAAVAKIEAALLNEGDGQALIDAIVQAIDAADIDTDILPGLIRDAILNRTLAGNHDTAGTVGSLLQYLDAAVSTRLASGSYSTPPSAASIADAVWDEALSDHSGTSGSTAEALDGAGGSGSSPSAEDIADAVWDEATAGHTTNGTFGANLDAKVSSVASGTSPQLLQTTTIDSLTSQTVFTLSAGSSDDDAYNEQIVIITDQSTSTQKAVGVVSDYDGATKTVTLASDPGVFTMAAGDSVDIVATSGVASRLGTAALAQLAGITITPSVPTWDGTQWSEPFRRGDYYIDNGSQDSRASITISGWTGPDISAATVQLRARRKDGEFTWDADEVVQSDASTYVIYWELSGGAGGDTDQLAGTWRFAVAASWDSPTEVRTLATGILEFDDGWVDV